MRHAALCCLIPLALSVCLRARAAEPAEVAFYECLRCPAPPVLDGRLDDPCWSSLPVMDHFYKYWSPVPLPPPLQTTARMCYDDHALYLGVTMFEVQLDQIRARVISRDDPHTWQDDCVEIMIDPQNTGSGYLKFTTNMNAARHELRAANLVLDDGWNVEGWQVKTARGDGAWTIEVAFPWEDLGAKPDEGAIWAFDLVRYGWATGAFKGVTWSLGGSGAAPQKFGYIGFGSFAPFAPAKLKQMAAAITPVKGDYFRIILPETVLTHAPSGQWEREALKAWVGDAQAAAEAEVRATRETLAALPDGPDKVRLQQATDEADRRVGELRPVAQAAKLVPGEASPAYHELLALTRKVAEVKWEGKVLDLVAQAAR